MLQNVPSLILAALVFALPTLSRAEAKTEVIPLPSNFVVEAGQTLSVPLSLARRIESLTIDALGVRGDSMIEVVVNGQVKGTIYAPGRDPSYVVTVNEYTNSIEFRHLSGSSMAISKILAVTGSWQAPYWPIQSGPTGREVKELAAVTLDAIGNLRLDATEADDKAYLFPIKRSAGLVFVMANAHGPISNQVKAELESLAVKIEDAKPYLDQRRQKDENFDHVVTLLTIRESILDLLN